MKTNKYWNQVQDEITYGDLQAAVDKLDALEVQAVGRRTRSPRRKIVTVNGVPKVTRQFMGCFVSYQPREGLYRVSFGTKNDPYGRSPSNQTVVYEYRAVKDYLKCDYDEYIYPLSGIPTAATVEKCDHIQAVLNYRKGSNAQKREVKTY